jgi:hypothetical protein
MSGKSFLNERTMPSAIISDGILTVPLWAVTSISLNESYRLPPIGSSSAKALVATHDDTVSLTGVLVGEDRFEWKLALENLADVGKRGSAIGALTGGKQSGLVLVTSMTIRTEMQIQSLSFSSSAARRDAIDVSISMAHMPLPGAIGKLLDMAAVAVPALTDWK